MLEPRAESMLGLMELLELRRRLSRCSFGFMGWSPDCRANRLRMSVSETTPVNRPEIRAPGKAAAETAGNVLESAGDVGFDELGDARTA